MSREIKFRGLDSSGNWQYGNLIRTFHFTYIADIHGLPAVSISTDRFLEVDPGTVGQYTGLKDRNGVEIYDGDWCRAQWRSKDQIKVIQGLIIMDEFMWCLDAGDDIYSINRLHNWEVISNIYQNPELKK